MKNQMIHILNWQFNWKLKHLLQNSAYIFISPTIPKYKNKHDKPFFFFSFPPSLSFCFTLRASFFIFKQKVSCTSNGSLKTTCTEVKAGQP